MSDYFGDFALGKTFDYKFTTVDSTGLPTTLAGGPVISAYPDNSLTELTAGITLTVDFDGLTGLHNVRVAVSGGSGYLSGSNYQLVITTGTVSGISVVGYTLGSFSIEARSALRPATADRTLVVDAAGLADANTVKLGPTGAGTAQTARDVGTSVLLSAGTGTGQLDFTSGVVKANLAQILGTALTETVGLLAGGFKKFFNVATPTGTLNSLPDAVPGAAGGLLVDDVWTDARAAKLDNLDVVVSTRATPAQVKTQAVDALATDTYAEPAQGTPAATTTLAAKLNTMYKFMINQVWQTNGQTSLYNNAGTVVDHKAAVSSDGTTYKRNKIMTGP